MTAKQLKRRIDYWVRVLEPFGLRHWDFSVTVFEGEIEDNEDARAAVDTSDLYDSARISFRGDVGEWEYGELDQVIIHELVHVLMRDFDEAIGEASYHLAPPARMLWDNTIRHEREGVVERIARTVYTLHPQ